MVDAGGSDRPGQHRVRMKFAHRGPMADTRARTPIVVLLPRRGRGTRVD